MLDQYAKVAQLRNMQQEAPLRQQALQQNVQAGAQDIAVKNQQMKDQQAVTKAMQGWDGKDLDELPSLVLKQGGSAQAVFGLKNSILDQKEKLSKVDTATLANTATKNDQVLGKLQSVTSDPDDSTLPQRITAAAQDAVKSGLIDPQHAQQLAQMTQTTQDPKALRQQLDIFEKSLMGQKEIFDQEQKQRTTKAAENTSAAKVQEAANATTRLNAEMPGGAMQPVEQKELSAYLAAHPGKTAQDFAAWKASLAPQATVNVQNAGAATGPGGQPSEIAKAIANNQMKWSDAVNARTPVAVKNEILKQVFKINPSFDTGEFGLEQDAAKKARSGAWADTRLAYNTALDHSDLLLQASKALDNGDTRALNDLKNKFKTQFGWDGQITYDAISNAYNHEVNSVISKGHITDAEIATGHATLPDNANQQTIQSVVGAYKGLMSSKRAELDKIIKAGAGNKADRTIAVGSSSDQGATSSTNDWASQFGGVTRK